MPGFIDGHVHLMFGTGPRGYDDVVTHDSDAVMLLRAVRNAELHLRAGVTTVRDAGARNRVTFDLDGVAAGLARSPRLLLCGRPLTITGGHFGGATRKPMGSTESAPPRAASSRRVLTSSRSWPVAARRMTPGARHTPSPSSRRPSPPRTRSARRRWPIVSAPIRSRARSRRVSTRSSISFLHRDGSRVFDERLAEHIVARGIVVSPTIQTTYRELEELETEGRT